MRVEEYNTVFYTHGFKHSFLCCAPSDKVPTSGPVMSPFWGPKRGGGGRRKGQVLYFCSEPVRVYTQTGKPGYLHTMEGGGKEEIYYCAGILKHFVPASEERGGVSPLL